MAEDGVAAAFGQLQDTNKYHYDDIEAMPDNIQKYWHSRYDLFSKYDEGVYLTNNSWFGITPEAVAHKIAAHIATTAPPSKTILIDTFCGAGGNTIAFALSNRWERIFAIEKDPEELKCAKHNAEIYGVSKKIWFIEGDCFDVMKKRFKGMGKQAVLFGSPPWGGPSYLHSGNVFNLSKMEPYNLKVLHEGFTKYCKDLVLFLPRTSNLNQIAELAEQIEEGDEQKKVQVVHYCMQGFSKALCVYYGNFAEITAA